MEKQKGFVLTRGMTIMVALVIIAFLVFVLIQNSSRPTPPGNAPEQNDSAQLTPEEQTDNTDTKVKEDLVRVATAVNDYASNNAGRYPTTDAQLDEVLAKYVSKPFLSPLTQNSYVLAFKPVPEQGVMSLLRGTCNSESNGVVPTENTRTYALLTALTNKSTYCIDL